MAGTRPRTATLSRLASATAAFLRAIGYVPGFDQAPERFARLKRALEAVRSDMRATGVTGEVRLIRPDWNPGNAAVETWAGDTGWTGGIFPSEAYGLGTSPQARHGVGIWWCKAGGGHVCAEIGHWPR